VVLSAHCGCCDVWELLWPWWQGVLMVPVVGVLMVLVVVS
jgi:hypothetical protein